MKKCLIVVDYQKDFVTGVLGFPESVAIGENIVEKIRQYRDKDHEILFTIDTHGSDYLKTQEGTALPVPHCVKGTEGHRLCESVGALAKDSDKKFEKGTFGSGQLYEYLKLQSFESIELVGVVSNICVIANAVLAKTAHPETPIIVDAKCTASNDSKLHKEALNIMQSLQIEVKNYVLDS